MKRLKYFVQILIGVVLSSCSNGEAFLSFEMDVDVQRDLSLVIRERLKVRAKGEQIKSGIVRAIETYYEHDDPAVPTISFSISDVNASRDDEYSPFVREQVGSTTVLKIGERGVQISPGEHSYSISYRTSTAVAVVGDKKSLVLQPISSGWNIPTGNITFRVNFPEGTVASEVGGRMYAVAGTDRPDQDNFRINYDESGITFKSSEHKKYPNGLVMVVSWK